MNLALTNALHNRIIPSTPVVGWPLFRVSPLEVVPNAPGTARTMELEIDSNASREAEMRLWYPSSKGNWTSTRKRVRWAKLGRGEYRSVTCSTSAFNCRADTVYRRSLSELTGSPESSASLTIVHASLAPSTSWYRSRTTEYVCA
jgi:hypothetical protein